MDIHLKKMIDPAEPLKNESQEKFCQEYVRLDIEDGVVNKKARRVKAYIFSYPETVKESEGVVSSRATYLLSRPHIKARIGHLYEEEGSSVENQYNWTRSKSEAILIGIAYNDELKTGDRLKAISELNKMRGIDVPKIDDTSTKENTVDSFFDSLRGEIDG